MGARIKTEREKLNLTQSQLGELVNKSASAIAMYENGSRVPRDEVKIKLSKIFGKTIEELFFNEE